jgi:diguanylate cyclase (GGDEF)-like protein
VFDESDTLIAFVGMAAGLATTCFSRGVFANAMGCLVCAAFVAFGFHTNVSGTENPDFWIMPVGIIITIGTAPVFVHYYSYFASSVIVWLVISYGRVAALVDSQDANWIVLIVFSSIVLGAMLNYLFVTERKKTFLVQRKLIELSFQDALTGISNRRGLMESMQNLHAKAATESFYFMIIDIDDFKRVNDTLGHDVGDKVLVEVATVIEQQAKAYAHGRLGGEEFGVVFAGEEKAACDFAKQLCESVAKLGHLVPAVTVSIGLSKLREAMSLSEIFKLADKGLYEAKHRGKNRYFLVS